MRKGLKGNRLSTETMLEYNGRIWFAEADSNGIYSYDLKSKRSTLECIIEEEPSNGKRLFRTMTICGDDLYVFPFSAENAYKINLHTKKVECIKIDTPPKNSYDHYSSQAKFLSSFRYGQKIFAVGVTYPAILEYDVETGIIQYYSEWLPEIRACFKNKEKVLFRRAEMVMNKLYIPSGRGDILLIFDMFTKEYEIRRIGIGEDGFSAVCYDGNDFWLAPLSMGAVIRWNEKAGKYTVYDNFPDDFVKADHGINDIVFWHDTVILFPGLSNMLLVINQQTDEIVELGYKLRNMSSVSQYIQENTLYAFSGSEDILIVFDGDIHCLEMLSIEAPQNEDCCLEKIDYIPENRIDTVKEFIYIFPENSTKRNDEGERKRTGSNKLIWNEIKELV